MWSPKGKAGCKRPDSQVLVTGGYILALVGVLLILSKTEVINTTGVRLWPYGQPNTPPPCGDTAGADGRLQAAGCSKAAAAVAEQQQARLQARDESAAGLEKLVENEEEEEDDEDVVLQASRAIEERQQLGAEEAEEEEEAADEGLGEAADEGVGSPLELDGASQSELDGRGEDAQLQQAENELALAEEHDAEDEGGVPLDEGEQQAAAALAAAVAAAVEQGEQQQQGQQQEQEGPSPYQQALASCDDLECLAEAAKQERWPGQYLFPHFYIVGWQKCATTSLFYHLAKSPQVLRADDKEPEFLSNECGYDPSDCPRKAAKKYIWKTMLLDRALEADLRVAAMEASTHYGRNGHVLAPRLREAMPWLKIVVALREPISRAISMLAHNLDKHETGCLTKKDAYGCLMKDLRRENYRGPLQGWLDSYPREQIYLIQYENITSSATMPAVLHDLKRYLEIDPDLPDSDLGMRNTREYHLERKGALQHGEEADGWPMKKWQYEDLIEQVRPDAQRVADLAGEYGLADSKQWMKNWEEEWRLTLEECDDNGDCVVYPN